MEPRGEGRVPDEVSEAVSELLKGIARPSI